tara:strand:- start:1440 stop:1718 length:279 start_codon:yes stop_codon:yes gene_type:complete
MKKIDITKEQVKTQREAIMWHLKTYGKITSWEAIKEYGVTRLADKILTLRNEGYNIKTKLVKKENRFGNISTIANYEYNVPKLYKQQQIIWG